MARLIERPARIESAGNKPKTIEEYFGRVNSDSATVSIARMVSPPGWIEAGQRPEFDEYTVVLHGTLVAETEDDTVEINAGQALLAEAGQWVRYSTLAASGAEYVAVCLPAFSPDIVHRD